MIAAVLLLAVAPPQVTAAVDKPEAALGDRVVATYTLRAPKGSRLVVETLVTPKRADDAPAGSGPVLEFEKPAVAEAKAEGGDVLLTQKVAFAPFATGVVAVPGPGLALVAPDGTRSGFRAPALALTVDSRLPKPAAADPKQKEKLEPRPARPVRIPSVSPWWWASLALALLAVAAAVVLWLRRRSRGFEGAGAAREEIAPGPQLLQELARLEQASGALSADARGWYSDLTHAVKRYLERRLGLPVLEWTTFETLRRLREAGLEPPREAALPELLSTADFVKFGKGAATAEAAREHLSRARLLHERLEAELARRAAAEAAAGGASLAVSSRGSAPAGDR